MTVKEATLNDVLQAVGAVGTKVDRLDARVGVLENRVAVVEGMGKAMPRAARAAAPAPAVEPPAQAETADDWQKDIKTSACYKVTIGRTKNDDHSKILCHLRGYSKPACKIGWDGDQELVDFFGEVLPWLSLEHFIDKGQTGQAEESYDANFLADWYRSKPNAMKKTFINIDAVYPV